MGGGLLAVVLLYEKLRKTDAMGGGDIKLLCLTGLYLGWMKNLLCLLLACVLGIVFALVTLKRRGGRTAHPLGALHLGRRHSDASVGRRHYRRLSESVLKVRYCL